MYADRPYEQEVEIASKIVHKLTYSTEYVFAPYVNISPRPALLDLGCGTGNHSRYFKKDFNVTGVDLSESMLTIARTKVPDVTFLQGDARTFNLTKKDFDVVCMMAAVLGYQTTNKQVLEILTNVRSHLKIGGLLFFDVWHGPAILLDPPKARKKTFKHDGKTITRITQPCLHVDLNCVTCDFYWQTAAPEVYQESHTQRYFSIPEIELFLDNTGFELCHISTPSSLEKPTKSDRDVLFVARAI
jgi:dTDP-3-amino-3,4,6-trideoxy-alpha-D-glucopyranose N,N-dimethyltransferase/N-dimethyltransferase